ncbi:hypothetical protein [Azospirillum endophyticum]
MFPAGKAIGPIGDIPTCDDLIRRMLADCRTHPRRAPALAAEWADGAGDIARRGSEDQLQDAGDDQKADDEDDQDGPAENFEHGVSPSIAWFAAPPEAGGATFMLGSTHAAGGGSRRKRIDVRLASCRWRPALRRG